MEKFVIRGGKPLAGSIRIAGSKNAVLPMLAATLLTRDVCTITNVPDILDVRNFLQILKNLGCEVSIKGGKVQIRAARLVSTRLDSRLGSSMRASVLLLGSLLARSGRVASPYPGGDLIGVRPIDVHVRAFRKLGASVVLRKRGLHIQTSKLRGAELFAESSVTGTENIVLAATTAAGRTVLKLAAQEPHVVELCRFLVAMGASIQGIGTHTLIIRGARRLRGASVRVIPDMLEAGSFAILAAATRSELRLRDVEHSHMDAVYHNLLEMGVPFDRAGSDLILHKPRQLTACTIRTGLYPNLATDLQPPFGVLATQARGTSIIHDWIFEGRLGYLKQLRRMGAKAQILDLHRALIEGPTKLGGATIESLDIRSGMTMVIAGLVATGKTIIVNTHNIDRGYEHLPERLQAIGADIQRIE
ncbi:MAG: UDP-N-acetylglucosamine 1-carboxyvinyltransferase [Candidatus Doudnabacteria bacterium RIFCSPHIGHO2_01_FULL_50_11]|uniref:UDP-N-acetylglucosamine 1-carboxyvinyltransferase n=1 Tax=Candidatus Doudnabacteria bacterium RIFCSPHIGHO2_01_FULL_50_11 TaxID=1817828 RepID=A0A1F5PMT8_9BACT|nr:MAG: UDP-N-acetylglucosamine 1-carboxyvinyltransferase [Candidatus Doudnabacteria bacterium RIFCSPHIGHO2_01_FULL_50_11]